MQAIMSLFAWLLGVAMLTLDYAVYYTVVKMGSYVEKLTAIGVTWRILRDLSNIALIFGFLAIGITTILNVDWYGGAKKMLPMLLVAAVFLNFSLFMTEAVIDTGNLFATQFYTQINGGSLPQKDASGLLTTASGELLNPLNEGVSNKIMSQLGLQTIYNEAKTNTLVFKGANPLFIGFMGILIFITTAFVMFSLAFILIARFVALIFLIILAPLGFAGLAIPQLKNTAKLWWDTLIEQTITAPILLLLLYVALAVITDAQFLTGFGITNASAATGLWAGFVENVNLPGFAGVLLSFLVAMGLLLAVTYFSKQLGAFGSQWAMKTAGKLSFGATAFASSALLNTSARGMRYGLQRYAPNSGVARGASRLLRSAESMRMDVRQMPGVGVGLAAFEAGDAAKPIEKSAGERVRQGTEWLKKSKLESDQQYARETVIPRLNTEVQSALQTGNYKQVSTILSTMSDKDLETSSAHKALVNNPVAAALLPQARFDKLQSSDTLSASQKAALTQARRDGDDPNNAQSRFSTIATSAFGATLPGTTTPHPFSGKTRGEALVGGMNTAARGKLAGNILTETTPPPATAPAGTPPSVTPRDAILNILDVSDFEAIRREGALTSAEKQAVGSYILNIATIPTPAGTAVPQRQASLIAASAAPAFKAYYNLP
jgi:hypothetical protein